MVERNLPIIAHGSMSIGTPKVYYENGRPVVDPDNCDWRRSPYRVYLEWRREEQKWDVRAASLGEGMRELFGPGSAPRLYPRNSPTQFCAE
jgi:hypothetical protein